MRPRYNPIQYPLPGIGYYNNGLILFLFFYASEARERPINLSISLSPFDDIINFIILTLYTIYIIYIY